MLAFLFSGFLVLFCVITRKIFSPKSLNLTISFNLFQNFPILHLQFLLFVIRMLHLVYQPKRNHKQYTELQNVLPFHAFGSMTPARRLLIHCDFLENQLGQQANEEAKREYEQKQDDVVGQYEYLLCSRTLALFSL
uniref:Uncharacterized protein n=1 Tax=Opuntia streptacantha TaxID=393608 RepID=A0A7C9ELX8_OPUST